MDLAYRQIAPNMATTVTATHRKLSVGPCRQVSSIGAYTKLDVLREHELVRPSPHHTTLRCLFIVSSYVSSQKTKACMWHRTAIMLHRRPTIGNCDTTKITIEQPDEPVAPYRGN